MHLYITGFGLVGDCVKLSGGVGEVVDREAGLIGWGGWESVDITAGKVFLVHRLNLSLFFEIALTVSL